MFNHDPVSYFQMPNRKLLALAFVLLLFLSGCRSAQLKKLESSVSIIQLTTGREVNRYTQDAERGFTGPEYAEVFIQYEPLESYTKKEVYDEIVDILRDNGWEGEGCEGCDYDSFSASLPLGDYPIPISAIVHLYSNENLVSIRLTHPKP